jgi:hypothetical protein
MRTFRIATRPGVLACRKCRRQTGLTVGTVMERSHTPLLSIWFWAAYLVASQPPLACRPSRFGVAGHPAPNIVAAAENGTGDGRTGAGRVSYQSSVAAAESTTASSPTTIDDHEPTDPKPPRKSKSKRRVKSAEEREADRAIKTEKPLYNQQHEPPIAPAHGRQGSPPSIDGSAPARRGPR